MTDFAACDPLADDPWGSGWPDPEGTPLYPLPFPVLDGHPEVFVPTQGSFLVWRHLFRTGAGAGLRCLDVGCGSGLQTIQLAHNGAAHVHGFDLEPRAAAVTLANARRNGVADRVTATAGDLFAWVPSERWDVVVASLFQMPEPGPEPGTGRGGDPSGRRSVDRLIGLLPRLLATDGVAYVMQLSVLSQRQTDELLAGLGLVARVVDFGFYEFTERIRPHAASIARNESSSDAHHLDVAGRRVMVAYLLEITRAR